MQGGLSLPPAMLPCGRAGSQRMAWDLWGQLQLMAWPASGKPRDPATVAPIPSAATFSWGGTEQLTPDGVSCPSAAQPALTGVKWVSLQPASAG